MLAAPQLHTDSQSSHVPLLTDLSLPCQKAVVFQTHLLNTLSRCLLPMAVLPGGRGGDQLTARLGAAIRMCPFPSAAAAH